MRNVLPSFAHTFYKKWIKKSKRATPAEKNITNILGEVGRIKWNITAAPIYKKYQIVGEKLIKVALLRIL